MFSPESSEPGDSAHNLAVLSAIVDSPESNPFEDYDASDGSLRALAEEIVRHHPGLAHILAGMGDTPCHFVHGQN